MAFINYLIPVLIAYSSIFGGVFLAYSTKEELKPGSKYFIILGEMLLLSIIALTLYQLLFNFSYTFAIPLLISVLLLLTKIKDLAIPFFFGVASYFSYDANMFFLTLSLIFISGLISGTLSASKNIKKPLLRNVRLTFTPYLTFVAASLLLYIGLTKLF